MKAVYAKFFFSPSLFSVLTLAGLLSLAACAVQSHAPSRIPPPKTSQTTWPLSGEWQGPTAPTSAPGKESGVSAQKQSVAVLLPLSGKNAALGQALFKAAQMALFDIRNPAIELAPYDTQGTAAGAMAAFNRATAAQSRLVIGPLFAEELKAIKPLVGSVPVLSFTTDATQGGGSVYTLGFLPADQIKRVVSYAKAQGLKRFAVLAPETEYANTILKTLQTLQVTVGPVIRYAPQQADLSVPIRQLSALAQGPDHQPAFDALVLPLGGESLRSLVAQMASQGLTSKNMRFIGTGLWDEPGVFSLATLQGGWYAAPMPAGAEAFEKKYQETYGALPPRVASLAYDAVAMAAVLARHGGSQPLSAENLTRVSGFMGSNGVFRLTSAGQTERGLAVLEMTGQGRHVREAAPTTLTGSAP